MNCPNCGSYNVFIKRSKPVGSTKRKRRYYCADCKQLFSTTEVIDTNLRGYTMKDKEDNNNGINALEKAD